MKNFLFILIATFFLFGGKTIFAQKTIDTVVPLSKSVAVRENTSDLTATGIKDSEGWEKYYSSGGGFEIFLPAPPELEKSPIEMPPMGKVDLILYTSTTENMAFMVGVLDFKIPINDPAMLKEMYDKWRDGVKEGLAGGTLTEKDGTFEGKPSREIVYTTDLLRMHGRVFFVKGKMFQLMSVYPRIVEGELSAKEIDRITEKFANSFKLDDPLIENKTNVSGAVLNEGAYQDDFYKFSVDLPKNWILINQDDMKIITEGTQARAKIYSRDTQKMLEKAVGRTTILFSLTKYEAGRAGNSTLLGGAEVDVSPQSNLMLVGKATETNFTRNMGYVITAKSKWIKLGAVDAILIEMEKNLDIIGLVKQKLYLIRRKGSILEFVVTYQNDEDAKVCEDALKTFKFIDQK